MKRLQKKIWTAFLAVVFLCGAISSIGLISALGDEEAIPQKGVYYTLTYPDGTVVTEKDGELLTYDDVTEALKEENWKLLGSGFTSDEEGKVQLPATWTYGTIKIIETKVPEGYTQGTEGEKTAELKDGSATFVNPKIREEEIIYTIIYKLNGGHYQGKTDDITEDYLDGTQITIHEAPERDGYTFDYWEGSTYYPGDTYTVIEDHTFVAQWKETDTPQDDDPSTPTVSPGAPKDDPGTPKKDTPKPTTQKSVAPKTGDNKNLLLLSALFAIAAFIMVLAYAGRLALAADNGVFSAKKRIAGIIAAILIALSMGAVMASIVYATDGFVINKIDDHDDPVEGAVFDVYGKPIVTFEEIPEDEPETIDVTGTKFWIDGGRTHDNAKEVKLTLYRAALGDVANAEQVTATPTWRDNKYTFADVTKSDRSGQVYTYWVTEEPVEGYDAPEYTNEAGLDTALPGAPNGGLITNELSQDFVEITVTKKWEDADNQDGKRPDDLTLSLYRTGKRAGMTYTEKVGVGTVDVSKNGNTWTYTFTRDNGTGEKSGHLKYAPDRSEFIYEVREETVPDGYTLKYQDASGAALDADSTGTSNGGTIINTHIPVTTSISGAKTWNNTLEIDGITKAWELPESIEITLQKSTDGTSWTDVETKTVKAADDWKYVFENLPVYDAGAELKYQVVEEEATGYAASGGSKAENYNLTNELDTITVKLIKTWEGGVPEGTREQHLPMLHAFGLYQAGSDVASYLGERDATYEINESNNTWEVTWENIPRYTQDMSALIDWEFQENAIDGYVAGEVGKTVDSGGNITFTVTNTPTMGFTVRKVWDDADNQDGIRPASVTLNLLADGTNVASVEMKASDGWDHEFYDLPQYKDGNAITYTVTEESVTAYTSEVTGDMASGFTVTNKHTPELISISGTKIWEDDNDRDGKRPDDITLRLHADGTVVDTQTVTPDASGAWKYEFADKPKYRSGGTEIVYHVTEDAEKDYQAHYTSTSNGFDITNEYTPGKTEIDVEKHWEDGDNQDGIRPDSVTLKLLADGADTDKTLTLNEDNEWEGIFEDLNEYRDGGIAIVYTVEEVETSVITGTDGPGTYAVEVSGSATEGFVVTNTHTPAVADLTVTKTWDDADNQDGVRRPGIVHLQKKVGDSGAWENDPDVAYAQVATNYTDSKTTVTTWEDLPVFENGETVYYRVEESNDPSSAGLLQQYTPTYDSGSGYKSLDERVPVTLEDGDKAIDIKNTHVPTTNTIAVEKNWYDGDNAGNTRPENLKITLYADGVEKTSVMLNDGNNWRADLGDFPNNSSGVPVSYTVEEEEIAGYVLTGRTAQSFMDLDGNTGMTITFHNTKTGDITLTKTWDDGSDQDGIRPSANEYKNSITLSKGSEEVDVTPTVVDNGDNTYTVTWAGQVLYDRNDGAISYTVTEEDITGYTKGEVSGSAAIGFTLTNTHTPETRSIAVEKVWKDAGYESSRPSQVQVTLYADGVDAEKDLTLDASNNWKGSFDNLPKYKDGTEIQYTVKETSPLGTIRVRAVNPGDFTYKTDITGSMADGFVVTNTINKVDLTLTKTWEDNDDQAGMRPIDDLGEPNFDFDNPYSKYLLVESRVGSERFDEYMGTYSVSILFDYGKNYDVVFKGLDRFDEDGNEIEYQIVELPIPGYNTERVIASGDMERGFTLTNTYTPNERTITLTKTWAGEYGNTSMRPSTDEFVSYLQVYQNGEQLTGDDLPTPNVVANRNTYTVTYVVPRLDENGNEYEYGIQEANVPFYLEGQISGDADAGFSVTNTLETIMIKVHKIWEGDEGNEDKRYPSDPNYDKNQFFAEMFTLGDGVMEIPGAQAPTYSNPHPEDEDYWHRVDLYGLPKYRIGTNGEEVPIDWQIWEGNTPEGYTSSVTAGPTKDADGNIEVTFTNTYDPEPDTPTLDLRLIKTWDDNNNEKNLRPMHDASEVSAVGAYYYDEYLIVKRAVGSNVPQPISVDTPAVTLIDANTYEVVYRNLPRFDGAGNRYVYSIEEDVSSLNSMHGYIQVSSGGNMRNGFTMTNALESTTTTVSGSKTWSYTLTPLQPEDVPESVTVKLMKSMDGDNWTDVSGYEQVITINSMSDISNGANSNKQYGEWSFEGLPKYDNGQEIQYKVVEAEVPRNFNMVGGTKDANGEYNITNAYHETHEG